MFATMANRLLHALIAVTVASCVELTKASPCSIDGSYDVIVRDISEKRPVGDVITTLNFNGSKDQITLTPMNNTYLEFNTETRELKIKKELDKEIINYSVTFIIKCTDNVANNAVSVSVIVFVKDVNDNPPVFSQKEYFISVSEAVKVGTIIRTKITATDADKGAGNNQVLFDIVQGEYSRFFDIEDKVNTNITLRQPLDYESVKNISIQIIAKDNPSTGTALSSITTLHITITDADDLSPTFELKNYVGKVDGNSPAGTVVNLNKPIYASDPDVTINASIRYSLYDENNNFEINSQSAEVKVIKTPASGEYTLLLEATQVDNRLRKGSAILKIIVGNAESNAPVFDRNGYYLSLPESTNIDTTILIVSASDTDKGDQVTYKLLSGEGIFYLDSQRGTLVLRNPLDFENRKLYNLSVEATDGTYSTSTFVEIQVTDVNDNNPDVIQREETVKAERKKGAVVTKLEVTDKDSDSKVSFVLRNHNDLFAINDAGELIISGQSDDLKENEYHLLVDIIDNGVPPRKESKLVIVEFPELPATGAIAMAGGDDTLAIVFGVIAAVMFIIVILLVIYIIRKRQQSTEHLDKAKLNRSLDPKGLAFKPNSASRNPPRIDMNYNGNIDETSDGATTIQENPFNDDGINYGYVHSDSETDRDMDEIQIETSVIPYQAYNHSKETYRDLDDLTDGNPYVNSSLSTFKNSSNDSINSESINSKKALVGTNSGSSTNKRPAMHSMSWDNNGHVPTMQSMQSFDDADIPVDEKPEITVYF